MEDPVVILKNHIAPFLSGIKFEEKGGSQIAFLLKLSQKSSLKPQKAKMIVAEEVLRCFYNKYKKQLERHIQKYLKYQEAGLEEVLQETWGDLIKLFSSEKLGGSDDSEEISNIVGYAKMIGQNKAFEYLSKKEKRKTDVDSYIQKYYPTESITESTEQIANKELVNLMTEYVHTQKEPLPQIFDLYYLQHLNSREISKRTNISHNTVRTYTAKIRRLLIEKFKGEI